jgi:hypothetical protein
VDPARGHESFVLDFFDVVTGRLRIDLTRSPHRSVEEIPQISTGSVVLLWGFAGDDFNGVAAAFTSGLCHGDILA